MNGEWIFQISLALASNLVSVLVGYFLGMRSQRKQGLREYIIETVKDRYPPLVSEIKRNSKHLDDFRGNPFVTFSFAELEQIFDKGLDEFIEKHHKDLFQIISLFHEKIRPKFKELQNQCRKSREWICEIWEQSLLESGFDARKSKSIAEDLMTTNNPFNTLSLFLGEKPKSLLEKIIENNTLDLGEYEGMSGEEIPESEMTEFLHYITSKEFLILGKIKSCIEKRISLKKLQKINIEEVSQLLITKAEPKITALLETYEELKKLNDKETKEQLLPLLKKYISNPI